jgi:PAS domain-containing protein
MLKPPGQWSDEQQRQADTLHVSFFLMFGTGSLYFILPARILEGQSLYYAAAMLCGIAGSLLLRFGYLRFSGTLSVTTLWAIFTTAAYTEGGITADAFAGNVATIVFAGLVLGVRVAIATAAGSILAGGVMVYLTYHNLLPPSAVTYSPLNIYTDFVVYLSFTAFFTGITVHRVSQSGSRMKLELEERKKAEEALRESEKRYRTLYQNAALGIFHSTFDGRFIDVNPALATLLGYDSPEEVVRSITNIAEQIYVVPQKRDEFTSSALRSGGVINVEKIGRASCRERV